MKFLIVVFIILAGLIIALNVYLYKRPIEQKPIDFKQLQRPDSPNYILACPKSYCNIQADIISPIFNIPLDKLVDCWQSIIAQTPRITILSTDNQNQQYQYMQRVWLFAFPDYLTIKLIPINERQSTIAMLSFSNYGYSDFGVNKRRVEKLLAALKQASHCDEYSDAAT